MNNTSSRPSKLQLHTMENSISCNKSEVDQTSLIKMCFEMCATLKETGSKFSFALKLDSGFNFSLSSGGMPGSSPKAKTKRHRSGSYLRRQARRRAAFLERKKKHLLEEEVTTTRQDNSVCVEEAGDVLNKNIASPISPVRYAKFESIRYFIDIDILQNCLIDIDIDIDIFQNHHIDIDIDIDIFGIALSISISISIFFRIALSISISISIFSKMTISISISIFFESVDISTIDMSYRYIEQCYLRTFSPMGSGGSCLKKRALVNLLFSRVSAVSWVAFLLGDPK